MTILDRIDENNMSASYHQIEKRASRPASYDKIIRAEIFPNSFRQRTSKSLRKLVPRLFEEIVDSEDAPIEILCSSLQFLGNRLKEFVEVLGTHRTRVTILISNYENDPVDTIGLLEAANVPYHLFARPIASTTIRIGCWLWHIPHFYGSSTDQSIYVRCSPGRYGTLFERCVGQFATIRAEIEQ